MSKFLKILEQVDPQNSDRQEMVHKLAELLNLINSVDVSTDGDMITITVDDTPIKLAIVNDNTDDEEEENPSDFAYSIDKGVEGLAAKPNFGGRFNKLSSAGKAKAAVKKREDVAAKAIDKYSAMTLNLANAISKFDSGSMKYNVTR